MDFLTQIFAENFRLRRVLSSNFRIRPPTQK